MSKKQSLVILTIFSIIIFIIGFNFLVQHANDFKNDEPKYWPPFFSFYKKEECLKTEDLTSNCYLGGFRVKNYYENKNYTVIELLSTLKSNNEIESIDVNSWECNMISHNRKSIERVKVNLFVPLSGDILRCYPKNG